MKFTERPPYTCSQAITNATIKASVNKPRPSRIVSDRTNGIGSSSIGRGLLRKRHAGITAARKPRPRSRIRRTEVKHEVRIGLQSASRILQNAIMNLLVIDDEPSLRRTLR